MCNCQIWYLTDTVGTCMHTCTITCTCGSGSATSMSASSLDGTLPSVGSHLYTQCYPPGHMNDQINMSVHLVVGTGNFSLLL